MGKTIAIANQKGGVGKTTTAVNLGACLAALHFRTLLVDFDPQGNASSGVGCERDAVEHSVYDVLAGRVSARGAIVGTTVPMLDLIAAKTDLAAAEIELVGEDNREHILRDSLADVVDDYDFIVLDCPPSLSLITLNALCAANTVLIPIQAEYYALEGLARLLETVEMLKKSLNPGLRIEGMQLRAGGTGEDVMCRKRRPRSWRLRRRAKSRGCVSRGLLKACGSSSRACRARSGSGFRRRRLASHLGAHAS